MKVFVGGSLKDVPLYADLCQRFVQLFGERIVERGHTSRILAGIRQAAFVIADATQASANAFYEMGFAEGLGRQVIVSAKKGTLLPFDVADIAVLFWSCPDELKEKLRARVQEIAPVIRRKT